MADMKKVRLATTGKTVEVDKNELEWLTAIGFLDTTGPDKSAPEPKREQKDGK